MIKTKLHIDRKMLLIAALLSRESILRYADAVFMRIPFISAFSGYIVPTFIAILFIWCLINGDFNNMRTTDLLLVTVFIVVMSVSYLVYPANQEYYSVNMSAVFLNAIPWFFIGLSFKIDKPMLDFLTAVSCLAVILNIFYLFYYTSTREFDDYSMNWAYIFLPHALLIINALFNKYSKPINFLLIVFTILSFMYILAMGTRGPVLILFTFFAITFFVKSRQNLRARLFFAGFIIFTVWFIQTDGFINAVSDLEGRISSLGFSTRVFDMFLSGEYIKHTSGRNEIFAMLLQKIKERPLLGYGVFGEWPFVHYVAHNIILELCVHYGIIVGLGFAGYTIFAEIKAFFVSKNIYAKDLIVLFFVFTWIRGIFGADYLSFYYCFLLGLSIQEIRTYKRGINNAGKAENNLQKSTAENKIFR